MAYNLESYQEPFWAKSGNFVRGRDPLGIQNSSISVYATLLPGMTNLTLRLRYYGMYMWLLDEYHNLPSDSAFKQSTEAQYTFVRRAELITAFLMVNKHPDELSVIGSIYANNHIEDSSTKGHYDIAKGADKKEKKSSDDKSEKEPEGNELYWDYVSGALGQYYAGSLISLGLVSVKNGFFERTEDKGRALAEGYRASLTKEAALLFLKRIEEGKLYPEDLKTLDDIALNKNLQGSAEGDLYQKILLSDDGLASMTASKKILKQRRESLQLFLDLVVVEGVNYVDMPKRIYSGYKETIGEKGSDGRLGWYYYYLNELAHHSLEAVFWGMLDVMDKRSYSLDQFLDEMTTKVCSLSEELIGQNTSLSLSAILDILNPDQFDALEGIDHIEQSVKGENAIAGVTHGILTLLALYRDNLSLTHVLKDYAIDRFLDQKNGNVLQIFDEYISSSLELRFKDFVSRFIHTLMNEHIAIAYKKMGNGQKNLLKFIIEDNYLVHIETIQPNFTNPRLRTLLNFTRDLGLVSSDMELTTEGQNLLTELNSAV